MSVERSFTPNLIGQHEKYGLDPLKETVLIMAGEYGQSTLIKICQGFLSKDYLQIVLVCGKKQTLKEEMERILKSNNRI
jgi:hypothetical protein